MVPSKHQRLCSDVRAGSSATDRERSVIRKSTDLFERAVFVKGRLRGQNNNRGSLFFDSTPKTARRAIIRRRWGAAPTERPAGETWGGGQDLLSAVLSRWAWNTRTCTTYILRRWRFPNPAAARMHALVFSCRTWSYLYVIENAVVSRVLLFAMAPFSIREKLSATHAAQTFPGRVVYR